MDFTDRLPQIVAGSNAVAAINEHFDAASPSMIYGRDAAGCDGLVWAYFGGRWGGNVVGDGSVTLSPSTTYYMSVSRADGSVTIEDTLYDWENSTDFCTAYIITTDTTKVSDYQDWRAGPGGTLWGGGTGGSSSAEDVSYDNGDSGLAAENVQDAIDELASVSGSTKFVQVALSDMTTSLTTGTAKAIWFAPENGQIVDVWIGVNGQSSSGVVRIDVNDSGGSIFTTRPAIDASESTSLTGTAAVLDGTVSFSKGDKFTFDIDDAGTSAEGLQAVIEYTPT